VGVPGDLMSNSIAPAPDSSRVEAPTAPTIDVNFMAWRREPACMRFGGGGGCARGQAPGLMTSRCTALRGCSRRTSTPESGDDAAGRPREMRSGYVGDG
jgi:hypothetical protein